MHLPTRPKQVLRRLIASPGFTIVALITIAAGIGANATIFGVVESVLLRPLPYPHPEQLISVLHTAPGAGIPELQVGPSNYFVYRTQSHTFQDIGLWTDDSISVTGLAEPEQVDALDVDDGTLPLLGVHPLLGRMFTPADDDSKAPPTALISYGYWQRKFGGSPSTIGKRVLMDGRAREIIGVLPKNFDFLDSHPAIIQPLAFDRSKVFVGHYSYHAIARLKPGVTLRQASADVNRMLHIVQRTFPLPPGFTMAQFTQARISSNLRTLDKEVVGDVGNTLWLLMGTIGMVLLIACANVANLLLIRAEGRQQELAIRSALGASWFQIASEILYESVALGLAGGVIGLAIAYGALRALVAIAPANLPRLDQISIDGNVVLFTALLSLAAGLLLGFIPVLKYVGVRINLALRQGGRNASASRERHRARNGLVVLQVTLALVLLISSGLMIRTGQALMNVDPGFRDPKDVQIFQLSISEAQIKNTEQVTRTQQQIVTAISALPGVSSVGLSNSAPMDGSGSIDPVFARDKTYSAGQIPVFRYQYISPGYFRTLGSRLVAGRDYEWTDLFGKHLVAIVSESMARKFWKDPRLAIGKQIRDSLTGEWRQVIGVAPDIHYDGVNKEAPVCVYWPILAAHLEGYDLTAVRSLDFFVRSDHAGSQNFIEGLRRAVSSVNDGLPLAQLTTLAELERKSLTRTSFTLVLLSIASAMALLLGVVGIYGVIAYSVSQRQREIGVRMAIGAQPAQLVQMFLRSGLLLVGIGIGLGLLISAAVMRLMSSVLFGVSPLDPLTYIAVSLTLACAAALATYLPSRRAIKVDPANALRAD